MLETICEMMNGYVCPVFHSHYAQTLIAFKFHTLVFISCIKSYWLNFGWDLSFLPYFLKEWKHLEGTILLSNERKNMKMIWFCHQRYTILILFHSFIIVKSNCPATTISNIICSLQVICILFFRFKLRWHDPCILRPSDKIRDSEMWDVRVST